MKKNGRRLEDSDGHGEGPAHGGAEGGSPDDGATSRQSKCKEIKREKENANDILRNTLKEL